MTTTEGNKIIAEFDNLQHSSNIYIRPETVDGILTLKEYKVLKYHSSYDWLMPVVEKIESLDYEFSVNSQWTGFGEYMTAGEINWIIEIDRDNDSLIDTVYKCVIHFIQLYNQTKK